MAYTAHQSSDYDALVIGGGPAGSTAAALLAEKGWRVLLLERGKFPRYSVGESLMPYCYFTLDRLGVIDQIKSAGFPKKNSVQFVSTKGDVSQPFYFFQHLKHEAATTWQVLRSEFDRILLENARSKGAQVLEETTVTALQRQGLRVTGVRAISGDGRCLEFRAPITVDASGRSAFSASRYRWRVRDPFLNRIAIWTYYRGATRDPGLDEGATTVAYLPRKGWFWYIPLADDVVSVGVVAEKNYLFVEQRDPEHVFLREVPKNPWVRRHLASGRRCEPFRVTREYSYRSARYASPGLVLVGDALGFLDPVFSSGVFLALKSGELAADAVDLALASDDVSTAPFQSYGAQINRGLEAMRKLVYAFYDHGFSFGRLMRKYPALRADLTDCLIGNLFRDFEELFAGVGEFASLPPTLQIQ